MGRIDYSVEIPKGASFILRHDLNAEVKGLDAFAPDHPPVAPVFWCFRIMVGVGVLMLALAWTSLFFLKTRPRWLLWAFAGMTFSGWVATLAGWMVTEIGRQPWLVTGILRTAEAAGSVPAAAIGASFAGYLFVYGVLLVAYMVVLTHMAGEGAQA